MVVSAEIQPVTSERAQEAFDCERRIVAGCSAIRGAWVSLASYLYDFHAGEMWRDLDYDSFNAWLGSPEISLQRSHVYALIETHRELILERGVDPADLAGLEATKISHVLPALRRGEIELDVALADAGSLSRSDLRDKYRGEPSGQPDTTLERCTDCGFLRKKAA